MGYSGGLEGIFNWLIFSGDVALGGQRNKLSYNVMIIQTQNFSVDQCPCMSVPINGHIHGGAR